MKAKKLDRRNVGYGDFKFSVSFVSKEEQKFCDVREWAWQQFGPSCEMDFWYKTGKKSSWCWINDRYRTAIYFNSEKEYQWFILKWQ